MTNEELNIALYEKLNDEQERFKAELMDKTNFRPALIIGVPVGFVNVVNAKEQIMETDVPWIVNRGRKGGSGVAAAICNALLYGM